ncbi:histone-lysine N-methyltransferase SETMAR [Trichonephila clavipes]|nr:histone-lysine N-methyltransferase SETMAR [Trichonephila clavipes]
MACNLEDCGFQMLNDDEIVTSVQEESDTVDRENNNNESSKGPSNADRFSALETAMECPIRATMLYHFEKEWKAALSFRDLNELFGKGTISESQCKEWFSRFKSGDTSLEDKPG